MMGPVATATAIPASRLHGHHDRPSMVSVGTIIWLSSELMFFAALFACYIGASEWVLGVNFLFAVTWTEVLDITEKLFEAADELGPE